MKHLTIMTIISFLISGCAAKPTSFKAGSSKEDVLAVKGKPLISTNKNRHEYLLYGHRGQMGLLRTYTFYYVKLQNETVISLGPSYQKGWGAPPSEVLSEKELNSLPEGYLAHLLSWENGGGMNNNERFMFSAEPLK